MFLYLPTRAFPRVEGVGWLVRLWVGGNFKTSVMLFAILDCQSQKNENKYLIVASIRFQT